MKVTTDEKRIEEVLSRGVSLIYPSKEELKKRLLSGDCLKIYLGADPTGSHLHLGHLTNLLTLRRLQALGHKIIFLIGDFTGRIGDPTGKTTARQKLSPEEVKENMRTFKNQISRIIDLSSVEIMYNSKWYGDMKLEYFMEYLLGQFSVQNLLERETLAKRLKSGETIQLQEFVYPLLQGYDGVEMDVDIEVGGYDQTFNMNAGGALRKAYARNNKKPKTSPGEKFFIATTLLENPVTGEKLMNKSTGGMINLDDSPENIFGKVMALDDASMFPVAEFCTEMNTEIVMGLRKDIQKGDNPRDTKIKIAHAVVETI